MNCAEVPPVGVRKPGAKYVWFQRPWKKLPSNGVLSVRSM